MGRWVRTRGLSLIAIGVCDRCHLKFPIVELTSDPNFPGLKVCKKDKDVFDPWRLPARPPDNITLPFVRPDVNLSTAALIAAEEAAALTDTRITELSDTRLSEEDDTRVTET